MENVYLIALGSSLKSDCVLTRNASLRARMVGTILGIRESTLRKSLGYDFVSSCGCIKEGTDVK